MKNNRRIKLELDNEYAYTEYRFFNKFNDEIRLD